MTRQPGAAGGSGAKGVTVCISVYAKPGSRRPAVGGRRDDSLVVAVTQRAVDGAANRAIVDALASALGVRRSTISIRSGARARKKVLAVEVVDQDAADVLVRAVEDLRSC